MESANEVIGRGFGGRIGAMGINQCCLHEIAFSTKSPADLVCAHLDIR